MITRKKKVRVECQERGTYGGEGNHKGPVAKVVAKDCEANSGNELDSALTCRNDVLRIVRREHFRRWWDLLLSL